jgi:mono/diheme cytochrome c family protein
MRFKSVGLALTVGMALIVVLLGFTLLSAGGLVGFAATDVETEQAPQPEGNSPAVSVKAAAPAAPMSAEAMAGDALFKNNCAQCHAVNEQVVGPALAGITKRRPVSWLIPWVKNSSKVVASGDEYGVALFNKYQKQQMPSFALSDKDITAIIAYINSQEGQGSVSGAPMAIVD